MIEVTHQISAVRRQIGARVLVGCRTGSDHQPELRDHGR